MLTKTDLKSFEKVLDNRLDVKLDAKLKPIHNDIKIIKKDVRKLRQQLKITSDTLDKENLKTAKRVTIIEDKLDLETPQFIGAQI